ncbi:hypothetical protein K2173_018464 [Erythroxylum novogranatense]|uniref:RING-type domain-containing protein n=1 Tax=Erythroxylum novogranatense TaxID=1862640 RepID=A0AAV8UAI2_9ROSI|nr:hypothetical protein K2173_018464 [Erythroxylum novogranatense]
MSAVDNRRVGLTMGAVLKLENRASAEMGPTVTQVNRTLLDIIRNEEPHGSLFGHKDKKSWKAFRDRLRFKRASAAAWNSLVPVPAPDILVNNNNASRSFLSRRNSAVSDQNHRGDGDDNSNVSSSSGPYMTDQSSGRFAAAPEENTGEPNIQSVVDDFGSQILENEEDRRRRLGEERALSGREEGGREEAEPVRMSLMDLLEETEIDRQMGFEASRYVVGTYEEEERGCERVEVELTCCVCMVRHKGAAFIPCGHTFCRLCSREIWVQRKVSSLQCLRTGNS